MTETGEDAAFRRSPATRVAGWGAVMLTVAVLVLAGLALARSVGILDNSRTLTVNGAAAAGVGTSDSELGAANALITVMYTVAFLVLLPITAGLLRFRNWARESAMAVFGLGGLLLLLLSLSGLRQDPPGENAALGLVCALLILGLTGAVVHPSCADDFSRYEAVRRAAERRRLEAERRARTGAPTSSLRPLN